MVIVGLLVAACTKTDRSAIMPEDPNWIRLEAPAGGQAMDVAGSVDSVLFVATLFNIYKTSDAGRSWERIRSDHVGPQGLYLRRDTLWRLTNRGGTPTVKTVSGRFAYYTADGGKTWKQDINSVELQRQINSVTAPGGTVYTVKENTTPIPNNIGSAYVNPSDINRQAENGNSRLVAFPYKHIITSLLLDSKNRLYVAVSGTHIVETNRIYCCPDDSPSVVYVSRNPLP
ncbi:hypothetical protein CLV58_13330 [Spirosoma oryzae]|uniref:BNR/Asp-box repeat protein n=2 Tax=Spirosoma oryzae TaxID=1469603 RepID=A0A2T0S1V0_9BACT|nr:hypothetical protein CLV58_13330 [Spirosoma oryzae]